MMLSGVMNTTCNIQGLTIDKIIGRVWSKNGSRGGDELNLIKLGKNYAWLVIAHSNVRTANFS